MGSSGGSDKGKAEGPSAKQAKPSKKDKKSKSSTDGAGTGAQGGQQQPPKPNKDNGTGRKRYLSDSELSSEKVPKNQILLAVSKKLKKLLLCNILSTKLAN